MIILFVAKDRALEIPTDQKSTVYDMRVKLSEVSLEYIIIYLITVSSVTLGDAQVDSFRLSTRLFPNHMRDFILISTCWFGAKEKLIQPDNSDKGANPLSGNHPARR